MNLKLTWLNKAQRKKENHAYTELQITHNVSRNRNVAQALRKDIWNVQIGTVIQEGKEKTVSHGRSNHTNQL